jgi:hypothetical protein
MDPRRLLSNRERPVQIAAWPGLQVESRAGSLKRSGVSPAGRKVDASDLGPIECRLAKCSELVGELVPATVAGELRDGVAELLDVDGVAAGPSIPLLEGVDLSSQDRHLVESAAEANPGVVAIERRLSLLDACPRLVVLVDVRAGAMPDLLKSFDGALASDFGGAELVASGPSPAQAGRVEAALCVAVLPPRLIGASRGGGKLLTGRRGRCLDTGEVASRRGRRGRKTSPLNLRVRHCLIGSLYLAA